EGEGSGQPTESQHTPTTTSPTHVEPIPIVASSSEPKKTQKHRKTKRKATEISQSSGPTTLVADVTVHEERGDSVERAATTATSLDAKQGSGGSPRRQDTILGDRAAQTRFERLSKQSNKPPLSRVNTLRIREDNTKLQELMDICTKLSDKVLDLENTQRRYGHDISTAEVTTASVPSDVDVSAASPIRPVDDSITDDITLAETLMKIKSSASRSQKDEGVMFKEPKLDEEARLEREREEEASNVALIEEWDSIEATIDADRQLAEQLQAQERDELTIVSNDDSAVNIESLATKYPIVDWKTHILTEDIIYYQIIKADGSTKNYKIFSAMLDDFDRQDVLDLNRLVKERFETTSPEGYDRLL
ncbi:hypothetical protein Tco_0956998, partial [Tanacetum coccineum]